ncbi:hypothetical protein RhiirA4_472043 [Rhizophagus irregularis]|uniref:C2H2-type domain-containing protein n=1 Tax=Rhizophagus irregularis TaxID=588596 RepID=A0A2I1H480_9GLOM|nr:hypothetical protein RhiirA4_472043 [Rhizophagus irregularis]
MVNQTSQNITHNCKWGGCTDKFDSMLSLWKHVEQQHVDNAIPRLIHFVNDDDEIPVTAPQNSTAMTKSSIDFVATSQINQSHNVYPTVHTGVINTTVSGTGNINNGQILIPMLPNLNLNLQGVQQTTQSRLQQGSHMLTSQISPTITYDDTFGRLPNAQMIKRQQYNNFILQPMVATQSPPNLLQLQQQQQALIQLTRQPNMRPLGSVPNNPITIDDNNTVDVGPTVINISNQTLGRPPVIQVQKKGSNLNRQSLSQNTKK